MRLAPCSMRANRSAIPMRESLGCTACAPKMPRSAPGFVAHLPRPRGLRLARVVPLERFVASSANGGMVWCAAASRGSAQFDSFDAFFEELFAYFGDPASWVPLPEVNATLQRLKDTNLKLGIISNFDHRLYRILDGLGLSEFFDTVTISSEAGYAKPARQIFAAALVVVGGDRLRRRLTSATPSTWTFAARKMPAFARSL